MEKTIRSIFGILLLLLFGLGFFVGCRGCVSESEHVKGESLQSFLSDPDINSRLFYPRHTPRPPNSTGRIYDIPVEPGVTIGARLHLTDSRRPTILLFHGNGEVVSDYDGLAGSFAASGLNLFVVDYRGYGWSTGRPALKSLLTDARISAEFCLKELTAVAPQSPVVLMGRSLGSGPASDLAVRHPDQFRALILESGYADVLPLLALLGIQADPLASQLEELFSNERKLRRTTLPLLIIHGENDQIIPVQAAKINAAARTGVTLKILADVGHNDLLLRRDEYFRTIEKFIAANLPRDSDGNQLLREKQSTREKQSARGKQASGR